MIVLVLGPLCGQSGQKLLWITSSPSHTRTDPIPLWVYQAAPGETGQTSSAAERRPLYELSVWVEIHSLLSGWRCED